MTSDGSRTEGTGPDTVTRRPADEEEHLGLFGSWPILYVTVVLYTAALTVLLYLATRLLDFSS